MIWTLVIFFLTFLLLKRKAFGPIANAIEERRAAVRENIESAERSRDEAQQLLEEYRQQLAESRHEADEIVERARRTAEESRGSCKEELRLEKERGIEQVQEAIARRDPAGARPDQERGRRPDAARHREGRRARARRGRAAPPDRRGARRGRLLQAARGRGSRCRPTPQVSVYGKALYEAAEGVGRAHGDRARPRRDPRGDRAEHRRSRAILYNPAFPARGKKEILARSSRPAPTRSCATSCRSWSTTGA